MRGAVILNSRCLHVALDDEQRVTDALDGAHDTLSCRSIHSICLQTMWKKDKYKKDIVGEKKNSKKLTNFICLFYLTVQYTE